MPKIPENCGQKAQAITPKTMNSTGNAIFLFIDSWLIINLPIILSSPQDLFLWYNGFCPARLASASRGRAH